MKSHFNSEGEALHLAWSFILAVTAFDACFAVAFEATLPLWEANPIQRAVFQWGGIGSVLLFRLGTVLSLLILLPYVRPVVANVATSIVFVAHLILFLLYTLMGPHNWMFLG